MRLSVVMATYNEEKNISDCLKTVINWCDEIIIIDGSSTDNTVAIAKRLGATVISTSNPPIFHINKQKAIIEAHGDWVLQLDADERLTPELKNEIDMVTEQNGADGYWIPRKNFFLGRFLMKGGVYPDYTLRLYKRGKGKLPQKDVHEQAQVEGKVDYLTNPFIHLADTSLERYFLRFNRYTDLIARELESSRKNPLLIAIPYIIIKPLFWFFSTYFRHKGFMDGWQGFLFSLFSSLRFPAGFSKYIFHTYESRDH